MKPLDGIKILDMTRILAGPWATQLLGDLGADVIKIERPGVGDDTRAWGPPYLRDSDGAETDEAAYYLSTNRAKRSVAIDFTTPEGGDIVRKLAASSDVLVENYKFGGLKKYGLDYAAVSIGNTGLIYCSVTGFGLTGPDREKPGYDAMIQAISGLMSVNGPADGEPGASPQKVGVAVSDLIAGFYAANAIQAALIQRGRTGKGGHIDIALYDCQVAAMANQALNFLVSGTAPGRMGTAHPNLVPYQVFATSDGFLMVAVGNNAQFARLANALGHPDWGSDARFATNRKRVENRDILIPLLAAVFVTAKTASWIAALEKAAIPHGPVRTLDQVFADPHLKARGLEVHLDHPLGGTVPQVTCPIRMSGADIGSKRPPPLLGEHTTEVLRERCGLSDAQIETMTENGVIGGAPPEVSN